MIKKIAKYLFAAVFVVVFVIIFIFLSRKIFVKVFNHFATSEVNVSNIAESSLDAVESEGIKDRTVKVVKGIYVTKQEWSGDVVVVGDVTILSALEIAPGTRIAIAAGKDEAPSRFDIEIHADGFNDDDPTRLKSYADTHISIFIVGSLTAKGTEEHPIIFTSDSDKPHYADWAGLNLVGNASVLDYVVVEYSRNGIAVPSANENMVVRNSIVRHAMWGCFSVDGSNGLFENNLAQDCGHEGFDVGGKALIKKDSVPLTEDTSNCA